MVYLINVTPCVGVWIETYSSEHQHNSEKVTPCVGVWIETKDKALRDYYKWSSHPAWVCGLKRLCTLVKRGKGLSHPAWVCGLKHILNTLQMYKKVTPCVGVWIETGKLAPDTLWTLSHPAWVCGLKQ